MEAATTAWLGQVRKIVNAGERVEPRGLPTIEVRRALVSFDARAPVVVDPMRACSPRFLSGEALWILSGSDRLDEIAPYNKKMAEYSDDGHTLFGAYGPRVSEQIDSVITKLGSDAASRQAVISLWRPNPPETRDLPCTLALHFSIRHDALDVLAVMRSSDAWLGLPYDMFTFTMIGWRVIAELNGRGRQVRPGSTSVFAASSHIYDEHIERARTLSRRRAGDNCDDVMRVIELIEHTSLPASSRALADPLAFASVTEELARARDEDRWPNLAKL